LAGFGWWTQKSLPDEFPVHVEELDRRAWKAGAQAFFVERYATFHRDLQALRSQFREEQNRWWSNLEVEEFRLAYQKLVDEGNLLIQATEQKRAVIRQELDDRILRERGQVVRLRAESRVFDLQRDMRALSMAEALLDEADRRSHGDQLKQSKRVIQAAVALLQQVEIHSLAQMIRYTEERDLSRWRSWFFRTVKTSEQNRDVALIVVKAEREIRVYDRGKLQSRYPVDLGFNGFEDKRYEGDGATPEGLFKVVRKKGPGETKFHKALLIDYPTDESRRRFQDGRRRGLIAVGQKIGGLIEIHGNTDDGEELTSGCVSVVNEAMDRIYSLARMGTPVTIVGAIDTENSVLADMQAIEEHRRSRPEWVMVARKT